MIINKTIIKGVCYGKFSPFVDERGEFKRIFCDKILKKFFPRKIKQSNLSYNKKKNTLRGFHYQEGKYSENKIISCLRGKIFDIVVDLRKNSKTYLKWVSFSLKSSENSFIIIPKGCANAFLTLSNNSTILYFTDNMYNLSMEKGVRYNDPLFNFKWPSKPNVISKKDKNIKNYKNELG